MTTSHLPIDPPGTILLEEYIAPMGLTQKAVAEATGIPYVRFNEIIKGKRRITAEYSLRLGRYFGQSEGFWLNLQTDTDLRLVHQKRGATIRRQVKPLAA
jgi:antitoxin HigA-1